MNRFGAISIVVIMAAFLGNLVVFDIIAIVRQANSMQSQIEYVDTGGHHGSTMLLINYVVDGYGRQDMAQKCLCSHGQVSNRSYSAACDKFAFPFVSHYYSAFYPKRGPHLIAPMFVDTPASVGYYLKG